MRFEMRSESNSPWTPPETSLPLEFVQSVQFVQKRGFGDPRDGEYRQVRVDIPGPLQNFESIRGWVLPARAGEPRRIVTIHGLTYFVANDGEPADFDRDLAAGTLNGHPTLMAALFLLRGDAERAERLYPSTPVYHIGPQTGNHPFLALSGLFLYYRWQQAVLAHSRGRTADALGIAQEIAHHLPDYEAEAKRVLGEDNLRLHFKLLADAGREPTVFPFLWFLPTLIEDSRRRLRNETEPPELDTILRQPSPQRIPTLIVALEESNASFMDDDPDFRADSVVQALIAEGEAALPALFEAAENDPRLTRAAGSRRRFFSDPKLFPVAMAAITAIQAILDVRTVQDPAKLKTLWSASQNRHQAQRHLALLRDTSVGGDAWSEAAESLFRGERPYPAEALPEESHAELTQLLEERALRLAGPNARPLAYSRALVMVRALTLWAPHGAGPIAERVLDVVLPFVVEKPDDLYVRTIDNEVGKAVSALMRVGYSNLFERYLLWLEQRRGRDQDISWASRSLFDPLVENHNLPEARESARRLFLGEQSPWNLFRLAYSWNGALHDVIGSPLIGIEAVQEALLQLLDAFDPLAEVEVAAPNYVRILSKEGHQVATFPVEDPDMPPVGRRIPLRVADSLMHDLGQFHGAPAFAPTWPTNRRDEAIEAMKRFLRENADVLPTLLKR